MDTHQQQREGNKDYKKEGSGAGRGGEVRRTGRRTEMGRKRSRGEGLQK